MESQQANLLVIQKTPTTRSLNNAACANDVKERKKLLNTPSLTGLHP
jgi:hypothetical protein